MMPPHAPSNTVTSYFSFSEALYRLKSGEKLANSAWDTENKYVYYVPANEYEPTTPTAIAQFGGENVPYLPYLALYSPKKPISMYTPSMEDLLSCDWYTVS